MEIVRSLIENVPASTTMVDLLFVIDNRQEMTEEELDLSLLELHQLARVREKALAKSA